MKKLTSIILILFLSLLSSTSWSEITRNDLVYRDGLWYKKFTDVPFTGKITGKEQGSIKDGKREGFWISYYDNGQLNWKVNYKNGLKEGKWVSYYENGKLWSEGEYDKFGEMTGEWVSYYDNGQLKQGGKYENGYMSGKQVFYNKDGTIDVESMENY